MDGEITIGTKLDTDKFDRQIKSLEKRIEKEESKKDIKIRAVVETDTKVLEQKRKVKELEDQYASLTQKIDHLNAVSSGKIKGTRQDFADLENYNQIIAQQEKLSDKISQAERKQANLTIQAERAKVAYQQMKNNVTEYKQKIEGIKLQKQVADVEKLKQGFNNVGNSIQNSIGKVAKLALGIFGIRSAYMALRRASSDLASYDQQYATNLEYIRYVLTQAIAPVLQWIVNLAAKLLGYINAIMQGWFGINLFSRGSAENFNKMKAGANGVNKAVKEIKKQLAGFDEITKLNEQSDTGTSVGAGGVGMPSFDLSAINAKPPKWLEWIINHKKEVLAILGAIAAALITLKLGFNAIMALGIGLAIYGVIEAVKGLLAFIKNPSWENFRRFLGGLAVAITGVAVAMIAFNATNPVGWILLAIGAVTALAAALVGLIGKLVSNKAQILSTKKAQEELTKAQEKAKEATDAYVNAVDNAEKAQKDLEEAERRNKLSGEQLYKAVQEGTLDYKDMNTAQREVYKAYLQNKSAQDELKNAAQELNNAKKEEIKASWENQLAIANEARNYVDLKHSIVDAYNQGKLSAGEARDYIERAMADMDDTTRRMFLENLPQEIKEGLNPTKYESAWKKFEKAWNDFWVKLRNKISMDVTIHYSAEGGGQGSKGSGGSIGSRAKGGIFHPGKLPRLAVGRIINQPGRGIPYHGAIIGERGAEAVVPLTDSQQMELLGETIGKYITLNATIPISVGNRQIAREIRRINAENEFAYNM